MTVSWLMPRSAKYGCVRSNFSSLNFRGGLGALSSGLGADADLGGLVGDGECSLVSYGKPSLQEQVWGAYRRGSSIEGDGLAGRSALLALLAGAKPHYEVKLTAEELDRLVIWMDASAQRFGAFDAAQEEHLRQLRAVNAALLSERRPEKSPEKPGSAGPG